MEGLSCPAPAARRAAPHQPRIAPIGQQSWWQREAKLTVGSDNVEAFRSVAWSPLILKASTPSHPHQPHSGPPHPIPSSEEPSSRHSDVLPLASWSGPPRLRRTGLHLDFAGGAFT